MRAIRAQWALAKALRITCYLMGYVLIVLMASWLLGRAWDLEQANETRAREAHIERMR